MKVELNKEGRFTLVAETETDNTLLFSIVNGVKYNGVSFRFPQAKRFSLREMFTRKKSEPTEAKPATNTLVGEVSLVEEEEPKPKRPYTKRKTSEDKSSKKRAYLKTCPVEGCEQKSRSMKLHLRNAHGVLPDGSLKETFTYNGGRRMKGADVPKHPVERPVKAPVVALPNGTYRVRPSKPGLLD